MDKNTLSTYGWVIITVIILSLLFAFATPFGERVTGEIETIPNKLSNSFGFGDGSSDNNDFDEPHTHRFTVEHLDDRYRLYEATCCTKATYYYSCSCGETGTDFFECGEVDSSNHTGGTTTTYEYVDATQHIVTELCGGCGATLSTLLEAHQENDTDTCPDCNGDSHIHSFTVKDTRTKYRKVKATCVDKAVFYYSCSCGEAGTETFEGGNVDSTNHVGGTTTKDEYYSNTQHNVCTYCDSCDRLISSYLADHDSNSGTCPGCNTHIHAYTEQVKSSKYEYRAATCCEFGSWYLSCTCGESSNSYNYTFTDYVQDNTNHDLSAGTYYTYEYDYNNIWVHYKITMCRNCNSEAGRTHVNCGTNGCNYIQTGCGTHAGYCSDCGHYAGVDGDCTYQNGTCTQCGGKQHPVTTENYYYLSNTTCYKQEVCTGCSTVVSEDYLNHEVGSDGICKNCDHD